MQPLLQVLIGALVAIAGVGAVLVFLPDVPLNDVRDATDDTTCNGFYCGGNFWASPFGLLVVIGALFVAIGQVGRLMEHVYWRKMHGSIVERAEQIVNEGKAAQTPVGDREFYVMLLKMGRTDLADRWKKERGL